MLPISRRAGALVWVLAVLLGIAAVALVGRLLPEKALGSWRKPALFGVFVGITVLAGLVIYHQLLAGRTVPLWLLLLILMATLDIMLVSSRPEELASYRLLLIGVTLVWVVTLICAGALRSTLLHLQMENMGIGAEYRDIQITSGDPDHLGRRPAGRRRGSGPVGPPPRRARRPQPGRPAAGGGRRQRRRTGRGHLGLPGRHRGRQGDRSPGRGARRCPLLVLSPAV